MIIGIGTDLMRVERLERAYQRFGARLPERILSARELEDFKRTKNPIRFLAMRFAGKEAVVKALGTGFANGVWVRDVTIYSDPLGKPCVEFSPRAEKICRERGGRRAHVSLTDEAGLVVAFAVLED